MSMYNDVRLLGRLVADPEMKTTPSGVAVTTARIAVDRPRGKDKDKEVQTDFITIEAWKDRAVFLSKYFAKGKLILLRGALHIDPYTDKNDQKRWMTKVYVEDIAFAPTEKRPDQPATETAAKSAPPAQILTDAPLSHSDYAMSVDDDLPF